MNWKTHQLADSLEQKPAGLALLKPEHKFSFFMELNVTTLAS